MPRRQIGIASNASSPRSNANVTAKSLQCVPCQRFFKKAEHLERHERSHLKQKPFACLTCSKAFGRKDVLSRHEKLHELLPSQDVSNPTARFREPEDIGIAMDGESRTPMDDVQNEFEVLGTSPSHQSPMSGTAISPTTALPSHQPWAASGDMLEMLMSDFTTSWPISLPLPVIPAHSYPPVDSSVAYQPVIMDRQIETLQVTVGPGHQAMDQMSRLISELSASLTAEIQSKGITSSFLDTCLHVFFDRFIPSFPILNKATFNVREFSHPLLLNIMALGSLFVGAKDAIIKGESLWKLAHTAVATNWAKLMATRGPNDRCKGVQLVMTALTGQAYAILSQNEAIRSTAQIFHGLGFYWAKQCRMYDKPYEAQSVPSLDATESEKIAAWKDWIAREVQSRAVLGHYILDGHISQFSGNSSCARHATNPLSMPTSDAPFTAMSADDWIREMEKLGSEGISFREMFVLLFSNSSVPRVVISAFALRVILEGLQSLVSDLHEAGGAAIGTPSKAEISRALLRLYNDYLSPGDKMTVDTTELLIRWHSVCLELATPATRLCRNMCAYYCIQQQLHDGTNQPDIDFDLSKWARTSDARRALLHAMAMQDIIEKLPLGRSQALHLPAAVFAASTLYCAFCLAGISSVSCPSEFRWEDVWSYGPTSAPNTPGSAAPGTGIGLFLQGAYPCRGMNSTTRNLMYDLNSLQIMLNALSRWGVSHEMGIILQRWISAATNESWPKMN